MISGYFSLGNFVSPNGRTPNDIEQRIKEYFAYKLEKPVFFTIEYPGLGKTSCVAPAVLSTFSGGEPSVITFNLVTTTLQVNLGTHTYTISTN